MVIRRKRRVSILCAVEGGLYYYNQKPDKAPPPPPGIKKKVLRENLRLLQIFLVLIFSKSTERCVEFSKHSKVFISLGRGEYGVTLLREVESPHNLHFSNTKSSYSNKWKAGGQELPKSCLTSGRRTCFRLQK